MTDQTSSGSPPTSAPGLVSGSSAQGSPARPVGVVAWYVGVVMLVIAVVASAWGDSPVGLSLPNLIAQSAWLLALICGVLWIVFGVGLVRTIRAQLTVLAAAVLVACALFFALVREIEFTGDMRMVFHWRWGLTQEDRLQQFSGQQAGSSVLSVGIRAAREADMPPAISPEDMPTFWGPAQDGRSPGPALQVDWAISPPREMWRRPVGAGYAAVAMVDDYLVTLEQRHDQEVVACYHLQTGEERWTYSYPASFFESAGGRGPRSTPAITAEGHVYTVGAMGDVCCLNLIDGTLIWSTNVLQKHGLKVMTWGLASSPLLWEDYVIVNAGGPQGSGLTALDRDTGREIWSGPGLSSGHTLQDENRGGYSTPLIVTLDGVEQLVHLDGEGLRGYLPQTGEILWSYPFSNSPGVNVAQPLLLPDQRIFITCSYGVGGRMVRISHPSSEWQVEELWGNTRMRCKFCSPMLIDGYIYGLDEGVLACIDPEDGTRLWRAGRYGHGQMLLRGEHLVIFAENGNVVLVRPSPEALDELAVFPVFQIEKNWNPHGLSRDILVVRNHYDMVALQLPVK